ncbi:beta-ketoacyl synthase N-terminal-like domain-containing protein, partial [Burkholderia pseudomallei]
RFADASAAPGADGAAECAPRPEAALNAEVEPGNGAAPAPEPEVGFRAGFEPVAPPMPRIEPAASTPPDQPAPQPGGAWHAGRGARPAADDDVAIIGISGRFPGARDVAEFGRNLFDGRDCIGEIPADRWDWRAYLGDPQHEAGKTNSKWGGFIDGIAEFDPLFFSLSPKEAYLLDPAHRLLLMHAWW